MRLMAFAARIRLVLGLLALLSSQGAVGTAQADDTRTDYELLLAFKSSFVNGDTVLASWANESSLCDDWIGIACNKAGRVTEVMLDRHDVGEALQGSMPQELWPLPPLLQQLDLTGHTLSGSLPANWSSLSRLTHLYLAQMQLSGTLPANLDLPSGLKVMYLPQNVLSGTIPAFQHLPAALQELSFATNNLEGPIPADWSLPRGMQQLDISINKLVGTIPAEWQLPSSLKRLDLAENSLSGPLPSWPQLESTKIFIHPGNDLVCGQVPSVPKYVDYTESSSQEGIPSENLPDCAPPGPPAPPPVPLPPANPSGSNTAAIAGGVGGAVGGAVLLVLLAWWCLRRRNRLRAAGNLADIKTEGDEKVSEDGIASSKKLTRRFDSANAATSADFLASITERLKSLPRTISDGDPHPGTPIVRAVSTKSSLMSARSVDINLWGIRFEDLHMQRQIGEGSFGKVFLATWQETMVAVKMLTGMAAPVGSAADCSEEAARVLSLSKSIMGNLQQEATLMASLRHPHVLSFMGICTLPPCLVSEYCALGSLYDILKQARASPAMAKKLDWQRRVMMAIGTAKGMLYLHSRRPPMIHRDLKSPNLLVDSNWKIKVSDFNLSKLMEETGHGSVASTTAANNPRWLAPEVLAGDKPTLASDVYSYAVVMWELITWELPFEGITNPWQMAKMVMAGSRPEIPAPDMLPGGGGVELQGLDTYLEIMRKCWAQDPAERPSFSQVIRDLRKLLPESLEAGPASSRKQQAVLQRVASPGGSSTEPPHTASDASKQSSVAAPGTPCEAGGW